jgi:hypothetical protein
MKTTHSCILLGVFLTVAAPAWGAPPDPAPQHGGRLLIATSALLEVVHDPVTGTLTLYAAKPAGGALELSRAPRYIVPSAGGTHEVALTAVPDVAGAWRATDPALKTKRLTGALEVLVGGTPQILQLGEKSQHQEGLLLFGGDALRLRFRANAEDGSLELTTVSATDALALGKEVPQVLVNESGREVALTLTGRTDVQDAAGWSVKDVAAVKAAGTLRVRAKVGAKTHEAAIHLANDEAVGVHGGPILTFGDGVARLEIVHDPAAGTLALHALPTPPDPQAARPETADIRLTAKAGVVDVKGGPVADCICVWLLRAPELREATLEGTVRIKVGDQVLESALPGVTKAKPQDAPVAQPRGGDPKR